MVSDMALGKIVVDGTGKTLYAFTNDTAGESTCYDACAASWPPLVVTGDITPGAGLDAEDFGTTTRTDGSKQVTFYGMPLYWYAGDKAAGDTNGQGLNDKWYVVATTGELIKG
jgi:predicted lipoprotein with Yx(FWY)xxD motif